MSNIFDFLTPKTVYNILYSLNLKSKYIQEISKSTDLTNSCVLVACRMMISYGFIKSVECRPDSRIKRYYEITENGKIALNNLGYFYE